MFHVVDMVLQFRCVCQLKTIVDLTWQVHKHSKSSHFIFSASRSDPCLCSKEILCSQI